MKITIKEAVELSIWEEVAEIGGYDCTVVNEGIDMNTEIELTTEQVMNLFCDI